MRLHPLGLGESLGDDLIINGPLAHSGQVWWVHSETGADAASPRGLERARPLATLAQAVSNAASGDIIVLMDGHEETITDGGEVTINKRLVIVGSGLSDGVPGASITNNVATGTMITISADHVELRNVYFPASEQSGNDQRIEVTGSFFRMIGCYFDSGQHENEPSVYLAGPYAVIRSCTFVSVSADGEDPPAAALLIGGGPGLYIDECSFDGGTQGWSLGWAIDTDENTDDVRMMNLTMLRGSDIRLTTSSTGLVLVNAGSYAPRIDWSHTPPG